MAALSKRGAESIQMSTQTLAAVICKALDKVALIVVNHYYSWQEAMNMIDYSKNLPSSPSTYFLKNLSFL